jgi:acetate kinase
MRRAILVLNAGSSSLKFALFEAAPSGDGPRPLLRGQVEGIGRAARFEAQDAGEHAGGGALPPAPDEAGMGQVRDHAGALDLLLGWLRDATAGLEIVAAGHRVVHGGERFTAPAAITTEVLDYLAGLAPLAPQHQPHNLAAIRALGARLPDLPQVACFDTAFHATQPAVATTMTLPADLRAKGLRRYGFHGLSYEYIAGALPAFCAPAPAPRRVVVAHLGNGASLCAIRDGRSVATTMGFSTLDGLVMGTRSGSQDPGVILYLLREEGYDLEDLTGLLYNRCGLLGLSGVSGDMRRLLESDAPEAETAVEVFCYRLSREIGSLAAALEGLDALVFTGGIGEHAAPIRARVCARAAWLGLDLDEAANAADGPRISAPGSRVSAWAIPTNEELVIARHTQALFGARAAPG